MSDRKLVTHVAMRVLEVVEEGKIVPIGVSNRHVHISQEHLEILFGKEYKLTNIKDLKQPGQYACEETLTIKGPKGEFKKVRILGPVRNRTQVEVSISDSFKLGIKAPIRESGNLDGTSGITLIGPKGQVTLETGVIVALRHIHMPPDMASMLEVEDKEFVNVQIEGIRAAQLSNVLVRVSDKYKLEMHVDVDEANACMLSNGDRVRIVK